MTDALIFDHVRTPRGRGRPDGSLHRITPIELAAQSLRDVGRVMAVLKPRLQGRVDLSEVSRLVKKRLAG